MKAIIEIDINNAAFKENGCQPELSKLLEKLSQTVGQYAELGIDIEIHPIYDSNGNHVGQLEIIP